MKKIFSAVLAGLLAITVISCSDEQDDLDYTKNDKISVEMISATNTTRSTSASVAQGEGLYRVSYQGISYDVMMSPSKAQKLNGSSSKNGWQTKKLYGFTSMEDDRNGLQGGKNYQLAISSKNSKEYGLAPGIYIAKSVLFVNKCKIPESCEIAQGEVNENIMGKDPSNRNTRGFSITRSGTDVIVKTAGTLIRCNSGGATVNKAYPVSKEKMEFNIAYLDINDPISDPVGDIQKVAYTPGSKTVSVDYTLKYAQNHPTIKIRDHWYNTIIKSVEVTNSRETKNIKLENVQLKDDYRYDVVLVENGKDLSVKNLSTTAVDSDGPAYASNQITNLWYDSSTNKINVDFQLKRSGATVGFRLLSTKSGSWYDGGSWYCPQNCGSYFINVPNETGNVLYIVVLTINGAEDGATKQIVVSR